MSVNSVPLEFLLSTIGAMTVAFWGILFTLVRCILIKKDKLDRVRYEELKRIIETLISVNDATHRDLWSRLYRHGHTGSCVENNCKLTVDHVVVSND